MVDKLLKWVTIVFGFFISVYILLYFASEGTKHHNYQHFGTVISNVRVTPDSLLIFSDVEPADFISTFTPDVGDTLVTIGDSAALYSVWNNTFHTTEAPGKDFSLVFKNGGLDYSSIVRTRQPDKIDIVQLLILNILRFVVAIAFVVVGIWAYFQRSDSGGIRALTFFSYSMALFLVTSVSVLHARYAAFDIPLQTVWINLGNYLVPYFSAFWLNLQLLFPHPHKFIRNRPVLAYLLCYAPATLFHLVYEFTGAASQLIVFLIITVQIVAGFVVLGYSYSKSRDTLERRQMRLVQMGSGFGLSTLFVILFTAILFNDWLNSWGGAEYLIIFLFIALLLSPLSFAYAFQKYRLFEVEAKLRRGTRYFIAIAALMAVLIGIVYLVGELLLQNLGITSRTPTLIIAMGLAFGFSPAYRRLKGMVEKSFYPEKHRLRETVIDFSQRMLSFADCKCLWAEVESALKNAVNLQTFYPIIGRNGHSYFYTTENDTEITTPFISERGLALRAINSKRPILVDEAIASEREGLSLDEEAWLVSRNISVLLPMIVREELSGFLAIGYKAGREELQPDEILILASFASQLAMASDNIRLLEDNIEKKRMEEELQMARSIQQGFLPSELPETPGLDISAGSIFCLEVAGDYYDVLSRGGGQTVLAVGDVSGKGAGAALLMANLQASLRTAVAISEHLGDIVTRMNDLIFINTPPEQYITFFTGVFNPKNHVLTYVNAGHNYPAVMRVNGEVDYLDEGGLILGAIPGAEYIQGTVELRPGDLLVMYTDGVTEAMNEEEEEFGEVRLVAYARQYFANPLKEIRLGLEEEVSKHTGGMPVADDFTLIFARVK